MCAENLGRRVVATGGVWIRRSIMDPSPVSHRLMRAPDAIHPLPQGGEGWGF